MVTMETVSTIAAVLVLFLVTSILISVIVIFSHVWADVSVMEVTSDLLQVLNHVQMFQLLDLRRIQDLSLWSSSDSSWAEQESTGWLRSRDWGCRLDSDEEQEDGGK